MKNRFLILIVVFSLITLISACKNSDCDCMNAIVHQHYSDKYMSTVRMALFDHIGNYQLTKDAAHLDTAIILLDEAIKLEPMKYSAYQYKAMALYWKKEYQEVIEVVDSLHSLGYEIPDLIFLKARIYNDIGEKTNADATLAYAERTYDNWVNCFPDSIALIISKIGCTAYIHGKEAALQELNEAIKKRPEDQVLIGFKDEIQNRFEESWYYREN